MQTENSPYARGEVSIVVPVYNRAAIVGRTLDSIKAQTYRPINLVLVDNNSTDDTLAVLKDWKERNETPGFKVTVVSETRPGAAAARNRGLQEVKKGLMMFFDSDDIMKPKLVAKAVKGFETPGTDAVYWRHRRLNADGTESLSHFTAKPREMMRCHLVHALICTPAYMTDRSVFDRIGGWNEDARVWDDYELGTRLIMAWKKPLGLEKVLFVVNSTEESITGTSFSPKAGEWEKVLDMVEKNLERGAGNDRAKNLRTVDYRRVILAAHYHREGNLEAASGLLAKTLASPRLNSWRRRLLRWVYKYTAEGCRGAWTIFGRQL